MAIFNFSFKIETSSRKQPKAVIEATTVNPKLMRFSSGLTKSNTDFAAELESLMNRFLYEYNEDNSIQ